MAGMAGKGVGKAVLDLPQQKPAGIVSAGIRLTTVQLKKEIQDSGLCHVALEMAKTGKRQVMAKDGSVVFEELSEAAHIDMIKFIVRKVLPDAKEYDSQDDRDHVAKWAGFLEANPPVRSESAKV